MHVLTANNEMKEINEIDGKSFYLDACGLSPDGNCSLFISFINDISSHRISKYEYSNQFIEKTMINDDDFSRNNLEYNANYILIRNKDSFEISNQNTNEYYNIKIPPHFHTVSYVSDSTFTISTSEKTYLFNINEKKIIDSFLPNKTVNRCFKDIEGNLWFATVAHGLYRLSSTEFKVYDLETGNMPAYTLSRFKNNLYIGSAKMLLWSLNLEENKLKKLKLGVEYNIGKVAAIQLKDNQNLFLGTDNGIFKISNSHIENFFPRTSVKSLFLHNDSLLVASDRLVYDADIYNLNSANAIWRGRATTACKFKNKYYIGTLGNLIIVDNTNNTTINLGDSSSLLRDKIVAITPVYNDDVWVATGNNGIVCLRGNKIIYHLTSNNGLTSNLCRCLYASGKVLWVGTEKGICKVDFSVYPFNITRFTAAEGLDCEIINCIYAQHDSVFAGTPFGVTFFNSGKVQNKSICKLKLVDIQSKNSDWFYKQDSIDLLSNDNYLQFQYAGISYVSSDDITYYYQLAGLDNTWQSTKQNSVEFQSLPAGNYTFSIFAINKYGIKSKIISTSFLKEKTFWQLWWFQTMLLVCIIFLIWIIVRQRIKAIKNSANNKLLREKKMHELEQMALRAQMNPHFIFNCLNSLQQYVFAGNVLEANQFITDFSSLIRQTLYISEKKFISLDEEITYLDTYLKIEQTKYENIFDYSINKGDVFAADPIQIPPLLLQPYVENSIRHGILNMHKYRGKIWASFVKEKNYLTCIIEDNGVGREKAIKIKNSTYSTHQSKGMELVKKRIISLNNIYNINIVVLIEDIKENNRSGTRVTIKLPLSYGE